MAVQKFRVVDSADPSVIQPSGYITLTQADGTPMNLDSKMQYYEQVIQSLSDRLDDHETRITALENPVIDA